MRLKLRNRLVIALSGLVLLCCTASLACRLFVGTSGYDWFLRILGSVNSMKPGTVLYVVVALIPLAIMALLGFWCVGMLFRRLRKVDEIRISGTNGDLTINASVVENLVAKCISSYDELSVIKTKLTESRDGVSINLKVDFANGVNIPMVKDLIQKNIKKYVLDCSGVDIHNVNIEVAKLSDKKSSSKYTVHQEKSAEEKSGEKRTWGSVKKEEAPKEEKPAEVTPTAENAPIAEEAAKADETAAPAVEEAEKADESSEVKADE